MDTSNKNYPPASEHLMRILKMTPADEDVTATSLDLPTGVPATGEPAPAGSVGDKDADVLNPDMKTETGIVTTKARVLSFSGTSTLKKILPYAVVFALGIFLYYFYFADFSFLQIFKHDTAQTSNVQKSAAYQKLQSADALKYQAWMRQFYFDISDSSVTEPDRDNSGNGLTNFQKYLLGLNPKTFSTPNDGQADGQKILAGTDPLTNKPLTDAQKKIVDDYFDTESIANKLTLAGFSTGTQKDTQVQTSYATPITLANQVYGARNSGAVAASRAGLVSYHPSQTGRVAGTAVGAVDTSVPGLLAIPKLKITVPVIWTTDAKNFDRDLARGVVHYPGTALPGEAGTSYISGHSSNYAWVKGSYNNIFAHIDQLKTGDAFTVTVTLKSGSKTTLSYTVEHSQEFQPGDQAQFLNTADSVVALSTCWPVGTTARRLVVFGKLDE